MTTKRAERFFHLIGLLRSGRGYTGAELAKITGVSQRTVYRDVVDLSTIVPIYYDDGYRLLAETYVANLALTRDELLALRLGAGIRPLADSSHLAAATRSALVKIEDQLARRFGADVSPDGEVVVHVAAHPTREGSARTLRMLEEATRERRTVNIVYFAFSRAETAARMVDPYGLTFRRHSWYVVGHCHLRKCTRVFRVDRILQIHKTPGRFEKPKSFSLEKFFADAWEVYASCLAARVKLAFAARLGPIVEPALGARGSFRAVAPKAVLVFDGEVPISDEFIRWLLAFDEDVEVLEPASLRAEIAGRHAAAARIYAARSPTR